MKQGKKLSFKVISILMTLAVSASMACACNKSEETKKRKSRNKKETEPVVTCDGGTQTTPTTTVDGGSESTPDVTGFSGDYKEDPEKVLFTYEHTNYAWGYHSSLILVMGDGKVYSLSDNLLSSYDPSDNSGQLEEKLDIITRFEPFCTLNADYLRELVEAASRVDPDSTYTEEFMMDDYGQAILYYWNENNEKVMCSNDGDVRYHFDDPDCGLVEDLWNRRDDNAIANPSFAHTALYLYTAYDLPLETVHCGYVELPQGDCGRYVFENYEVFSKFCEENHIDMAAFTAFDDDSFRQFPILVQFDLFSTMGHERSYDALVIEDNAYYFLPSENCTDPDPDSSVDEAMDGFVTVCIFPDLGDRLADEILAKDGEKWEIRTAGTET